jgi:hypothetical protein
MHTDKELLDWLDSRYLDEINFSTAINGTMQSNDPLYNQIVRMQAIGATVREIIEYAIMIEER